MSVKIELLFKTSNLRYHKQILLLDYAYMITLLL